MAGKIRAASLEVGLDINGAKYAEKLDKLRKKTKDETSIMGQAFTVLGNIAKTSLVAGLGAATLAMAGLTAATVTLGSSLMEEAKQLALWSTQLGLSTKQLNKLAYSAKLYGFEMEVIGDSISSLMERINDTAANGGVMEDFFNLQTASKAVGAYRAVAKEWANMSDTTEVFFKFTDALDKMPTGLAAFFARDIGGEFEHLYSISRLMGKTFRELNDESERFGASIINTTGWLNLMTAFNALKFEFNNIAMAAGNLLAKPFADTLNTLQLKFNEWVKTFDKDTGDLQKGFKNMVSEISIQVLESIKSFTETMMTLFNGIKWVFDKLAGLIESTGTVKFVSSLSTTAKNQLSPTEKASLKYYGETRLLLKEMADKQQDPYKSAELTSDLIKRLNYVGVKVGSPEYGAIPPPQILIARYDTFFSNYIDKLNNKYPRDTTNDVDIMQVFLDSIDTGIANIKNGLTQEDQTPPKRQNYSPGISTSDRDMADLAKAAADELRNLRYAAFDAAQALQVMREDFKLIPAGNGFDRETQQQMRDLASAYRDLRDANTELATKQKDITKDNIELKGIMSQNQQAFKGLTDAVSINKVLMQQEADDRKKLIAVRELELAKERERLALDQAVGGADLRQNLGLELKNIDNPALTKIFGKSTLDLESMSQERQQFNLDTIKGVQELQSYYETLGEDIKRIYGEDSAAYKNMLQEQKNLYSEYTEHRIKEEERLKNSTSADGVLADFYNVLKMKEGALDNHQSVIEGYSNAELETNMKTSEGQRDLALAGGSQLLSMAAQTNEKAFKLNQALQIAIAIGNTAQAVTKALAEGGPYAGPALAGLMTAIGMAQVMMIKNQKFQGGQFHDGIDYVPREGTYLLAQGERVVDSRLNQDLKDYLKDGNRQQQPVYAPVTNINTQMSADDMYEIMRKDKYRFSRLFSSAAFGM
ncbi:hypothetical protein ACEUA8_01460 [Aeromonas veronii]